MTEKFSLIMIPLLVAAVAVAMARPKKDGFSDFTVGAKNGIELTFRILPTMVLLTVAVKMVTASGLADFIAELLYPVGEKLGIPKELMPLIVMRPVSGSGSSAVLMDIFDRHGVDSFAGICASVLFGSSETIIYVISVYFGSIGVKKTRYAIPCAFAVMLLCIILTCAVCSRIT
ncbi:MAG: spore maturation protein [Eubacteriales bacterium]|nr:spore maturation protein [Eubacteriales bacterium]